MPSPHIIYSNTTQFTCFGHDEDKVVIFPHEHYRFTVDNVIIALIIPAAVVVVGIILWFLRVDDNGNGSTNLLFSLRDFGREFLLVFKRCSESNHKVVLKV